jgi:hypothetical protein
MQPTNGRNCTCKPAVSVDDPITADFDTWDDLIQVLSDAMWSMARTKLLIEEEQAAIERIEASHILRVEGPNAEARKASLTLELADDAAYAAHLRTLRQAKERLMGDERVIATTKERCRLIRAAIACFGRDVD